MYELPMVLIFSTSWKKHSSSSCTDRQKMIYLLTSYWSFYQTSFIHMIVLLWQEKFPLADVNKHYLHLRTKIISRACVCVCDLIEVGDDVVEEAETLDGLMNELLLLIEGGETWQRGEEDANSLVGLWVQLLWTHTHTHTESSPWYTQWQTHTCLVAGTSSLRSLSRKCCATWAGRMLSSRHSLCSLSSFMSSTSFLAWRRHRKSSRAVASIYQRRRIQKIRMTKCPSVLKVNNSSIYRAQVELTCLLL